jgi:hypothetical protein
VRKLWCAWFAGFFLVALGWAGLTPLDEYPDESDHVLRAAALVRGDLFPTVGAYTHGTGAVVDVPRSLLAAFTDEPCRGLRVRPLCRDHPGDPATVTVVTSEGRVFPVYDLIVGWPTRLFPDRLGVRLMRVVSAALCSALLASAAVVLGARKGLLAVALTPLALYLTGAVNPSAPEVAAAVCFWACVLARLHGDRVPYPALLLSGVGLATTRLLGPLWVGLVLGLALLTVPRGARRPALRGLLRPVLGPIAGATVIMVAWAVTFRTFRTFASLTPVTLSRREQVAASVRNTGPLLEQIVGWFGWLTVPPPTLTLLGWGAAGLVLVALDRRPPVLLGAALVLALPFVLQVASFPRAGLGGWQGRYTLPLAVGVPLLVRVPQAKVLWVLFGLCGVGQVAAGFAATRAFVSPAHLRLTVAGMVVLALGAGVLAILTGWSPRPSSGRGAPAWGWASGGSRASTSASPPASRTSGRRSARSSSCPR